MPDGFRRHLVGKTLKKMFATVTSLKYALPANERIVFHLNNIINLRFLTPHIIIPYYAHKMAIAS